MADAQLTVRERRRKTLCFFLKRKIPSSYAILAYDIFLCNTSVIYLLKGEIFVMILDFFKSLQ